jgi:DNA-binding transcriptional MerR regulator
MAPDSISPLLPIGEFACRIQLTAKVLRIYDQIGLLRPVDVDRSNGHRRYGVEQVCTARLIGILRGADLSLGEIGSLLSDLATDRGAVIRQLDRHQIELETRHTSRRFLIRHIHAILREEDPSMFLNSDPTRACAGSDVDPTSVVGPGDRQLRP